MLTIEDKYPKPPFPQEKKGFFKDAIVVTESVFGRPTFFHPPPTPQNTLLGVEGGIQEGVGYINLAAGGFKMEPPPLPLKNAFCQEWGGGCIISPWILKNAQKVPKSVFLDFFGYFLGLSADVMAARVSTAESVFFSHFLWKTILEYKNSRLPACLEDFLGRNLWNTNFGTRRVCQTTFPVCQEFRKIRVRLRLFGGLGSRVVRSMGLERCLQGRGLVPKAAFGVQAS